MGDEGRVAATNRLARFEYFMVTNATCRNVFIDRHLCALKPDYAQSRQRLAAMSVVAGATTNAGERVRAQAIVDTLSLVPTNELNNVSWLTDDRDGLNAIHEIEAQLPPARGLARRGGNMVK